MLDTMVLNTLSELLYPNLVNSPSDIENKYPQRVLAPGAVVTRFAPSPTGFVHIGSLYAALVAERVAHLSKGIFFLRIEDTDQKRELVGGIDKIVYGLKNLGILIDEGVFENGREVGIYGPYKQTDRMDIYNVFAKELVKKGHAYPCFLSQEEISQIRFEQEKAKIKPGIYGKWSRYRGASLEEVKKMINEGHSWVLRLYAPDNLEPGSKYQDLIKGSISITPNDQDTVLIKSDGIPTYHFAHIVDDHLMKTTHVIRADEWLPSLPLHLQLFSFFGWEPPVYAHISPIVKMDGPSKRKLSKRKDPEANVDYYWEHGYPVLALTEYLLNIANSGFEDWRKENPNLDPFSYPLTLSKMNKSGALFDEIKLNDVSANVISKFSPQEVLNYVLEWSKMYDTNLFKLLESNKEYALKVFGLERSGAKVRKDLACWSQVSNLYGFFFDDSFVPSGFTNDGSINLLKKYLTFVNPSKSFPNSKEEWFEAFKKVAEESGFSTDNRQYKENPTAFKGSLSDAAAVLRISLSNKTQTPDLYEMQQVMGLERVISRLQKSIQSLS